MGNHLSQTSWLPPKLYQHSPTALEWNVEDHRTSVQLEDSCCPCLASGFSPGHREATRVGQT
jgi:hypothetical protein